MAFSYLTGALLRAGTPLSPTILISFIVISVLHIGHVWSMPSVSNIFFKYEQFTGNLQCLQYPKSSATTCLWINWHLLSRSNTVWNVVQTFRTVFLEVWNWLFAERTRWFKLWNLIFNWFHSYFLDSIYKFFRNLRISVLITPSLYYGLTTTMAHLYASPFNYARIDLITIVVKMLAAWTGNWEIFLATLSSSRAVSTWLSIFVSLLIATMYECKIFNFFSNSIGIGTLAFLISW